MLLALDPGMNSPGVALFDTPILVTPREPRLIAAKRVEVPAGFAQLEDGARWLEVAKRISGFAVKYMGGPQSPLDVVFEKPQWYQRAKSKGDPNQLAGVAGVAAATIGRLSMIMQLNVRSPTPAEWIGQLPKVCPACHGKAKRKCAECHGSAWGTPRGRRIRSRLSAAEIALVPDQNDAIDAVGIGLWALGRLEPRSVFSNGSDGR